MDIRKHWMTVLFILIFLVATVPYLVGAGLLIGGVSAIAGFGLMLGITIVRLVFTGLGNVAKSLHRPVRPADNLTTTAPATPAPPTKSQQLEEIKRTFGEDLRLIEQMPLSEDEMAVVKAERERRMLEQVNRLMG